jgi:nucleoside-diphosphate-sugar epimerase
MRILLVGGAGFIGHNLALALRTRGHEVAVFDSMAINHLHSPESKEPEYIDFLLDRMTLLKENGVIVTRGDATGYHGLSRTAREFQPHAIVHLSAVAHANRARKMRHETFDNNLKTLENVLDIAAQRDVFPDAPHVVYFSSSMVYGDFKLGQALESFECDPKTLYGGVKLAGENLIKGYRELGVPYTIIRPSALYGPRCISGRVIQKFIEAARRGEPVRVQESSSLDFTYINDLVDGVVLALESDVRGETFNMTYGKARQLLEVLRILREHYPDLTWEKQPNEMEMPNRGTCVMAKAKNLLGHEPKWPLEKGIPAYVDWYENR